VHTDEGRIIVEKIHMIKRHMRPSRLTQQGALSSARARYTYRTLCWCVPL
jgi:hypothetical protein